MMCKFILPKSGGFEATLFLSNGSVKHTIFRYLPHVCRPQRPAHASPYILGLFDRFCAPNMMVIDAPIAASRHLRCRAVQLA